MTLRRELAKLGALFRRRKPLDDLTEEIRAHLAMEEQENLESGMTPDEAHYAALRRFGNATLAQERSREMWGWNFFETLSQDIRYGSRQLRQSPWLTLVITLSLALGIGANTAIFSVINAVMLRLLPVQDPERLVEIAYQGQRSNQTFVDETFSYPMFKEIRERNQVFSDVAVAGQWPFAESGPEPPRWTGQLVSANFFSVLGVNAVAGRVFAVDEDKGVHPVVVISYALWTRRFGRDPRVIGRRMILGGAPFTIVGVAPAHFSGLDPGQPYDLWAPITMLPQVNNGCECRLLTKAQFWNVVGRLKPRTSLEQARANVDLLFQQMQHEEDTARFSEAQRKDFFSERIIVLPAARGRDYLRKEFSRPLFLLMGMVALVLLIACANVANLLLARASVRQREIAVRSALGAGRGRLLRQLLTESVVLALIGGALGVLFAYWGSPALVAMMARGRNQLALDVHPDLPVLGFTLLVALATGIAFGLAPALSGSRTGAGPSLQARSRNLTDSFAGRIGQTLVVAQVALALVLVIGAGLLVRTLRNLETSDPGFSRQGVLVFGIAPTLLGYKGDRLEQFYQQLQEEISQIPGVSSASFSHVTPIGSNLRDGFISVQGYTPQNRGDVRNYLAFVGPRFFKTSGIPLLAGRDFGSQDQSVSPPVAIINQTLARRFFAGRNPIGQKLGWIRSRQTQEYEIIGVVGDAKYFSLREAMLPIAYFDVLQGELGDLYVEVRVASNPTGLIPQIRSLLHTFDSRLAPWDPTTLEEQIDASLYQEKLVSTLSSAFGVLALLLACVGLYGIMAYAVARRTDEIGLRMALGAQRGDVLKLIAGQGLKLTLIGLGVGILCSLGATRLLGSLLFGVKPIDRLTFISVSLLVSFLALLAGYIPARRATKVDPMVALRYE
jgi:macrolide transport system ATP-binding/permease protein